MNGVDENSSTSSFIKSIKLNYKYYIGGGYQIWTDMVFKYRKILGLLCLPISPNPHNKKMAPRTGLEPVTYGLTVRRSTDWTTEE